MIRPIEDGNGLIALPRDCPCGTKVGSPPHCSLWIYEVVTIQQYPLHSPSQSLGSPGNVRRLSVPSGYTHSRIMCSALGVGLHSPLSAALRDFLVLGPRRLVTPTHQQLTWLPLEIVKIHIQRRHTSHKWLQWRIAKISPCSGHYIRNNVNPLFRIGLGVPCPPYLLVFHI